jgi:plasmid maintenance system antidote protein VapI
MKSKKRKAGAVSESLRAAIRDSGLSLYAIAKGAGIGYAQIHRFASGERSLSLDAVDRLAAYFGLSLKR